MQRERITLWDPLVRLFHASLALSFLANYFFNEAGESWHQYLGYYAALWLVARIIWGFVGPRPARWSDFWPTRDSLRSHAAALLGGRDDYHRLGHSPIGALVMILMMTLMAGLAITGFLMEEVDYFWGADGPMLLHEWMADGLLALVCLHLAAALFESWRLGENLPLSMLTGRRNASPPPPAGDNHSRSRS